jgi:hypothetical protein
MKRTYPVGLDPELGPVFINRVRPGPLIPLFPAPAEVVACCQIRYSAVEGVVLHVARRYWTADAQRLATQVANTVGISCPAGLGLLSEHRRIPLKKFLAKLSLVGGLPAGFCRRALARWGVDKRLAPSLLWTDPFLALQGFKEGVLQFMSKAPAEAPSRYLMKRIKIIRFMESCWDALRQVWIAADLPFNLEWLIPCLLFNPYETAKRLKEFSDEARAIAFRKIRQGASPLWGQITGLSEVQHLQLSAIGRALPAPLAYPDPVPGFVARMVIAFEWPPDRLEMFHRWVFLWAVKNRPKVVELRSTFTTSGCFEFNRSQGGIPKACYAYGLYQYCVEQVGKRFTLFDGQLTNLTPFPWISSEKWRLVVGGCLSVSRLWYGRIPAEALDAPEKGLKVRIPTKTILPVLVLLGFLRGLIDQFMVNDDRIRPSITPGDPFRHKFPVIQGMKWRSLDCRFATDYFSVGYLRAIYTAVITVADLPAAQTEFLWEIFNWGITLRGLWYNPETNRPPDKPTFPPWEEPSVVLERKTYSSAPMLGCMPNCDACREYASYRTYCPDHRAPAAASTVQIRPRKPLTGDEYLLLDYSTPWSAIKPETYRRWGLLCDLDPIGFQLEHGRPPMPKTLSYLRRFGAWIQAVCDTPKVPLQRGAMMGDPTSWPGLPLMTLFSWEQSSTRPNDVSTTGDDAYMQMSEEEKTSFDYHMTTQGTEFSDPKDFFCLNLLVYIEQVRRDREVVPIQSVTPLSAPLGGSKGESSWATAPASAVALGTARGALPRPRQWRASRFFPEWRALQRLGVPTHLPPRWGGLGLPGGKFEIGIYHKLWANKVAKLSRLDLVLRGTGLLIAEQPSFSPLTPEQSLSEHSYFLTAQELKTDKGVMGPKSGTHWGVYRGTAADVSSVRAAEDNRLSASGADSYLTWGQEASRWFSQLVKSSTLEPSSPSAIKLADVGEFLTRPAALNALLSGHRPERGKNPSVFRSGNRFRRAVVRAQDRGFPQSDELLILSKESLVQDLWVDPTVGVFRFQPGVLPRLQPYDNG